MVRWDSTGIHFKTWEVIIAAGGLFLAFLAWFTGLAGDYNDFRDATNRRIGAKVNVVTATNTFSMPPQLLSGVEKIDRLQNTSPELKSISEELAILDDLNQQLTMQIANTGDEPAAEVFLQLPIDGIGYVNDDNDKRIKTFDKFTGKIDIGEIRGGESVIVCLYFKSPLIHGDPIVVNFLGGTIPLQVTELGIQTYSYQYEFFMILFGVALAAIIIVAGQFGYSFINRHEKAT